LFEGERATLIFQRRLLHPPEAVWAAIVDPKQVSMWYMLEAEIDGRVGGSIHFSGGPSQFDVTGRILQWDPPRVLEYEWKIRPRPGMPSGEDAVVRWELDRDGRETLLTLTHRNVTRQIAGGIGPATHVLLDRLGAMLNGRPLPEMKQRFAEVQGQYPARQA
jgi:uncharacterized protein YndB with AHSA1/START domain